MFAFCAIENRLPCSNNNMPKKYLKEIVSEIKTKKQVVNKTFYFNPGFGSSI